MSIPELLLFPISHYCEKAWWALDHHGISHRTRNLAPGLHVIRLRRMGLRRSTVPVLLTEAEAVQGSSAIVDWCDAHSVDAERTLTPVEHADACREMEARLDARLGVQIRRHAYSALLFEEPARVREFFAASVDSAEALVVRLSWPMLRRMMVKGMDLGPAQRIAARDAISEELDWLDECLVDGRRFLIGDRFTRADLAAASLLAPITRPPERPAQSPGPLPAGMAEDVAAWSLRPSFQWALRLYGSHRAAAAEADDAARGGSD